MRQAPSGSDLTTKTIRSGSSDDVGVARLTLLAVLGLGCGCKLNKDGTAMTQSSARARAPAVEVPIEWQDPPASDETVKAMMSRVCGSPAVDGYAHVDAKCLEESPTAKWWNMYYIRGGRQTDLVAHVEKAADFDGLAVGWGIGNKKASIEDCAMACMMYKPKDNRGWWARKRDKNGIRPFENLPCNAFTWCAEEVCFEPDAHKHTKGDCWLKFTEGPANPEINFRGHLPPEYRERHKTAPETVQWWGGVLLPPGVQPTNGTFGPRWKW